MADDLTIAHKQLATGKTVATILQIDVPGDNTRSEWMLFTLANGDVIFGCYPTGETFEGITQDPAQRGR